jgi:tartrate/fumarate subfamily iron-sulfur-dependent hydro-lyase beta chain
LYFTGFFFTGRSKFHVQALERGTPPPIDYAKVNVLMHIGPVFKKEDGRWIPVGLDATSSFRFEKWEPELILRLGIRAIIGKTTMGAKTAEAMREFGCVHLTRVGVPGNLLARRIRRVVDVYGLEEYGMTEATWVLEADDLGPFIVDIDAQGRNLFRHVEDAVALKMKVLYRRFGIPDDFKYSMDA